MLYCCDIHYRVIDCYGYNRVSFTSISILDKLKEAKFDSIKSANLLCKNGSISQNSTKFTIYLWKCTEYSDREIRAMNREKEMDKFTFLHDNRSWAKYSMFDKNNTCCQARNIELHRTFNGE